LKTASLANSYLQNSQVGICGVLVETEKSPGQASRVLQDLWRNLYITQTVNATGIKGRGVGGGGREIQGFSPSEVVAKMELKWFGRN
jgi:hypothetical protein